MNIKEQILEALRGKRPKNFPLTIYTGKGAGRFVKLLFDGFWERRLRNRGLGLVYRTSAYEAINEDLEFAKKKYRKGGNVYVNTIWRSSAGELTKTAQVEPGYGSNYALKKFIKKDKDYEILSQMLEEQIFIPRYDQLKILQRNLGNDGIVMVRTNKSVYNRLIYEYIDIEKFSIDLHQQKPEMLAFMDTLKKQDRKIMKIIAESPAELVQIPDNITGPMIGRERFKKYCGDFYNWAWDLLKASEKLLCVHMDGHLNSIAKEIGETNLPIVEGFTPPPDGDLNLKDAHRMWPQKSIWLNFPSSVHIRSSKEIRNCTRELLKNGPEKGLLFGITENVPEKHWFRSLSSILDVLEKA